MEVSVETCWKSLNKIHEELCGDKVEILKTEDSDVVILADGMGSGVKANILATLTSKILRTMFQKGAPIEQGVETIARTLPICQVRQVAYSTFSILQIFHNGEAYLVEYDNPGCIFVRDGKLMDIPYTVREIEGKKIREYRFQVKLKDCFVLMSDGVIYAGVGELLNFGWTWESMADYTVKCTRDTLSAKRLAAMLSQACDDLYMQKPGDDTTVAVARVIERKVVNIFTGPPKDMDDDERIMLDFITSPGKHIVSGGTTASIASRYLKQPVTNNYDGTPEVPPTSNIKGIDLVTEGVLTMNRTLYLLRELAKDDVDFDIFLQLDEDNGAAKLAKIISEECTDLNLFVGKANNTAHETLLFDVSVRHNLVEQLKEAAEKLGKNVTIRYYPLYGSGAVLMLFLTIPVRGNYLLMYIVGAIGATVLEYITGTVMENLFGVRYWDYTDKKFNFRGRICLEATVLWGFFTLVMVEVIQPPVEHMVMMINDRVLYYMTWGITVVFTFDFASSFRTAIDLKEVLIQAERAKEEVQRMQKRVEVLEAVVNDSLESAKDGMEVRWDEQKQRMALLTEERMTELARHMDALRKRLENSESIERIREAVETSGAGEKLEDIQNEMRQMRGRIEAMRMRARTKMHPRQLHMMLRNPSARSFKYQEGWRYLKNKMSRGEDNEKK